MMSDQPRSMLMGGDPGSVISEKKGVKCETFKRFTVSKVNSPDCLARFVVDVLTNLVI